MLFYTVALLTRSNFPWAQIMFAPRSQISRHLALHLPFPNLFEGFTTESAAEAKLRFLRLWNDQFSSFWTEALNPFKVPFSRTISDIASVPHSNGVVFLAVPIAISILSVVIAQIVDKSGSRQLNVLGLCLFLGWYSASLGAWLGPLFGAMVVVGQVIFLFIMSGRVPVVRAGDVVRVE